MKISENRPLEIFEKNCASLIYKNQAKIFWR